LVRSANPTATYGQGEATFQAAGGEAGIRKLVDHFYDIMASEPMYQRIYDWHPDDTTARDKLARFLCGWMGGPRRYQEHYGPISIPAVHQHLPVTATERDMWLGCMAQALAQQDYPQALRDYLLEQFSFPAELIRRRCEAE
jgi:hemoglobin